MNKAPRFIVDCADHEGFIRLVSGQKRVITRANKSSRRQDDYADSKIGDVLELVDNLTGEKLRVQITDVQTFGSLSELYRNSQIAQQTFGKEFKSEEELMQEYEKNRPGYSNIIHKNGVVVWHVRPEHSEGYGEAKVHP